MADRAVGLDMLGLNGCARASASPALGRFRSKTASSHSASDFQRLSKSETRAGSANPATYTRVCDTPEAIRLALKDWLTGLGLLKHRDDPEMAN